MLKLNIIKQPVDQSWTIERIAKEAPPTTWESVMEDAVLELKDISDILIEQERMFGRFYPNKADIFKAFHATPLKSVKVVIVGQDPYHQTVHLNGVTQPRAVGMSFSVRKEDSIPSSLQNIYKELAETIYGFTKPVHGDLTEWARQGVLLLNTCLTVMPTSKAGSHGDLWLGFIVKVLKAIAIVNPTCIFVLWGRYAQNIKPMLGERSIVLEAAHPSGLSAKRGFFGCNHFKLINDHLISQGKVGINWKISLPNNANGSEPQKLPSYFGTANIREPTNVSGSLIANPNTPIPNFYCPPTNTKPSKGNRTIMVAPITVNSLKYNTQKLPTIVGFNPSNAATEDTNIDGSNNDSGANDSSELKKSDEILQVVPFKQSLNLLADKKDFVPKESIVIAPTKTIAIPIVNFGQTSKSRSNSPDLMVSSLSNSPTHDILPKISPIVSFS
jgi:uracil-DNA glycosylase